jgi:hypothetical protein
VSISSNSFNCWDIFVGFYLVTLLTYTASSWHLAIAFLFDWLACWKVLLHF